MAAGPEGAAKEEPAWLALFRAAAPGEEVAAAWYNAMSDAERQAAGENDLAKATARGQLRTLIVHSDCPEVRADVAAGFKYTSTVLRAADAVLGIPPPKSRFSAGDRNGGGPSAQRLKAGEVATKGSGGVERSGFRPRLVVQGDGKPGSLTLWWSDYETAKKAEQLKTECGVTHRLNVAVECVGRMGKVKDADESDILPTAHVPMVDQFDPEAELCDQWPEQLEEVLAKLRAWREEGAVVNVNCQMGKNRSGCVCMLWMCCEMGWTMDAATDRLRAITPLAVGNPHLLAAVAKLLKTTCEVPLNPAADGGGWVCISPPGTPRGDGEVMKHEAEMMEAIRRMQQGTGPPAAEAAEEESEEEVAGEMGALFDDLSDVD